MATHTHHGPHSNARPLKVPLGGSRGELLGLVLVLCVLAAVAVSFWFEAMR